MQTCVLAKVREKGLTDATIKLEALLKFGRTLEATTAHSKAISNNSTTLEVNAMQQVQQPKSTHHSFRGSGRGRGFHNRARTGQNWQKSTRRVHVVHVSLNLLYGGS